MFNARNLARNWGMSRPEWCNRVNNVNRSFGAPRPLPKKRDEARKAKPVVDCNKPVSMDAPIRRLSLQRVQDTAVHAARTRGNRPTLRAKTRTHSAQTKAAWAQNELQFESCKRTSRTVGVASRVVRFDEKHMRRPQPRVQLENGRPDIDDSLVEIQSQQDGQWSAQDGIYQRWENVQPAKESMRSPGNGPPGRLWHSVYDACQEAGAPLSASPSSLAVAASQGQDARRRASVFMDESCVHNIGKRAVHEEADFADERYRKYKADLSKARTKSTPKSFVTWEYLARIYAKPKDNRTPSPSQERLSDALEDRTTPEVRRGDIQDSNSISSIVKKSTCLPTTSLSPNAAASTYNAAADPPELELIRATVETLQSSWLSPSLKSSVEESKLIQPRIFFKEPVEAEYFGLVQSAEVESGPLSNSCAYSDTFEADADSGADESAQVERRY